jgi:hypothetical protein
MDDTMIKLYCEWDIGHEGVVFTSKEKAREWARKHLAYAGVEETLEECEDYGLIGYETVEVV